MAILVVVKSMKTGVTKVFYPDDLTVHEGSVAYGGIEVFISMYPMTDLETAAQAWIEKLMKAGLFGTWKAYMVDTQEPSNSPRNEDFYGYAMHNLWELKKYMPSPCPSPFEHKQGE